MFAEQQEKGAKNLKKFKHHLENPKKLLKDVEFDKILKFDSEMRDQPHYFKHFAKEMMGKFRTRLHNLAERLFNYKFDESVQ